MVSMSLRISDSIYVRASHHPRKGTRVELRDAVNRKLYRSESDASKILELVPEDCWPAFAYDYLVVVARQHELRDAQGELF